MHGSKRVLSKSFTNETMLAMSTISKQSSLVKHHRSKGEGDAGQSMTISGSWPRPNIILPNFKSKPWKTGGLFTKAAFVIVPDPDKFRGEANNKLAALSRTTRAVVESFQPYNRPHHKVAPSLLGALSVFANTNKHKLILPVFAVPQNLRFTLSTQTPSRGTVTATIGNIEDGSPFFVYKTDVPEPGTTINFAELKTEIALTHKSMPDVPPPSAGGTPTRFLVPAIIQEVDEAIRAVANSLSAVSSPPTVVPDLR